MNMPKCELCEKKVKTTYKCTECGTRFCEKCGEKERNVCEDCIDYANGAMGQYKPDQKVEIEIDTD